MNSFKKMLLLCFGVVLCMFFFNSCESTEKRDKRHARESYQSIESCINGKNVLGFKQLFNSLGSSALDEDDIESIFSSFSSGITLNERPYDDYISVTDWVEGGSYGKNIGWAREIINNKTGERFNLSVLECTHDSFDEDLGIICLIIYPLEKEDEFDLWWNELEDEDQPNGLILYGI